MQDLLTVAQYVKRAGCLKQNIYAIVSRLKSKGKKSNKFFSYLMVGKTILLRPKPLFYEKYSEVPESDPNKMGMDIDASLAAEFGDD